MDPWQNANSVYDGAENSLFSAAATGEKVAKRQPVAQATPARLSVGSGGAAKQAAYLGKRKKGAGLNGSALVPAAESGKVADAAEMGYPPEPTASGSAARPRTIFKIGKTGYKAYEMCSEGETTFKKKLQMEADHPLKAATGTTVESGLSNLRTADAVGGRPPRTAAGQASKASGRFGKQSAGLLPGAHDQSHATAAGLFATATNQQAAMEEPGPRQDDAKKSQTVLRPGREAKGLDATGAASPGRSSMHARVRNFDPSEAAELDQMHAEGFRREPASAQPRQVPDPHGREQLVQSATQHNKVRPAKLPELGNKRRELKGKRLGADTHLDQPIKVNFTKTPHLLTSTEPILGVESKKKLVQTVKREHKAQADVIVRTCTAGSKRPGGAQPIGSNEKQVHAMRQGPTRLSAKRPSSTGQTSDLNDPATE